MSATPLRRITEPKNTPRAQPGPGGLSTRRSPCTGGLTSRRSPCTGGLTSRRSPKASEAPSARHGDLNWLDLRLVKVHQHRLLGLGERLVAGQVAHQQPQV